MKKPYIFATITIILWGTSSVTIKHLLAEFTGLQALFCCFSLASLLLFFAICIQGKLKEFKKYKFKDYAILFSLGAFGVFLYNMLNTYSYNFATGTEAAAINYLWPLWIIITSIFILKEKLTKRKIIATAISLFGMILVVTRGDFTSLARANSIGVAMAFVCSFCYGLFSTLCKKIHYDKVISTFLFFLSGALIAFVCVLLFSSFPTITLQNSLWLLLRGFGQFGIAWLAWNIALTKGDTVKMANLALITPFLQLAMLAIFTGEKIGLLSVLGLVFIICGTIIARGGETLNG